MKNPKHSRGFTLLELMLVLAITAVAAVSAANVIRGKAETDLANASADNIVTLGQALTTYIADNTGSLSGLPTTPVTVAALQGGAACATSACLPSTFVPSAWTGGYTILVRRLGTAPYQFEAMACSTNGWVVNGATRTDLVGTAVKRIGGPGGMTYDTTSGPVGLGGTWSSTVANYPSTNVAGELCYYVSQTTTALDSIYLRRDGTNNMTGALQMNAHDIVGAATVNATTMTATGAITGNSLASGTNLNLNGGTGQIISAGRLSIQSGENLYLQPSANAAGSPTIIGGSGGSGALTATSVGATTVTASDKVTATNDVVITTLPSRTGSPSLTTTSVKSLLPNLVEVSTVNVTADGQTIAKPGCSNPQIFMIPQNTKGPVVSGNWGSQIKANDMGSYWQVSAVSGNNSAAELVGFQAIARIFCAY